MRVARRPAVALSALALSAIGAVVLPAAPASADDIRDRQWQLRTLHVAEAQRITQGEGIVVAVLDSGVDANHPDLKGNVLPGLDLFDGKAKGQVDRDPGGHGTSMASLIAGHGHGPGNRDGVLGIAPKAKILPVTVERKGYPALGGALATAVTWAVDQGADVINVSLAGGTNDDLERAVEYAWDKNVLVVAGAGNKETNLGVNWPAAYPPCLAVTNVGPDGKISPNAVTGEEIDIAAPGVNVVGATPGGRYATATGSSNSTAIVSGAAALVRAKYPNLSTHDVFGRLIETSKDAGPKGFDETFGWGSLDLMNALTGQPDGRASKTAEPTPSDTAAALLPEANESPNSKWDKIRGAGLFFLILAVLVLAVVFGIRSLRRRRRRRATDPVAAPGASVGATAAAGTAAGAGPGLPVPPTQPGRETGTPPGETGTRPGVVDDQAGQGDDSVWRPPAR
ncbi:type VII secretion-associated serine protease mycosin [Plantactinospora siamensis]|uniref:Type VII secretion-associated serine protease mycosin n=1 Tax=Plantactinospora siamensis TaxID=555372 RepID=A0ABV6NRL3_9ACTN